MLYMSLHRQVYDTTKNTILTMISTAGFLAGGKPSFLFVLSLFGVFFDK